MTSPERSAAHDAAPPAGTRAALGDRRGLTALGGSLVALAAGLGGLGYDLASGNGLRVAFAVAFLAGCVLAALLVHREDLFAVVVMPPLAYLVLSVTAAVLQRAGSGSLLTQQAIGVVNAVVLGAPVLLSATAAAALVALARAVLGRRR